MRQSNAQSARAIGPQLSALRHVIANAKILQSVILVTAQPITQKDEELVLSYPNASPQCTTVFQFESPTFPCQSRQDFIILMCFDSLSRTLLCICVGSLFNKRICLLDKLKTYTSVNVPLPTCNFLCHTPTGPLYHALFIWI